MLTDIAGVTVGHAEDLALGSGVTAILFDRPAVASVSVLGGAPGSRDTAMLAPENSVPAVDAIVLSGGSAFGLDAAGGVQAALREQGPRLVLRGALIPLVAQAIIFDLANGGNKDWGRFSPYRDLGYAAAGRCDRGTVCAGLGGGGHRRDHGHGEGRPRVGERRDARRPYRGGDRCGQRGGLAADRGRAVVLGRALRAGQGVWWAWMARNVRHGATIEGHAGDQHDDRAGRHRCRADQAAGDAAGHHGA